MSEHGEPLPNRTIADPIALVGVVLLLLFVAMIGRSVFTAIVGDSEMAVVADSASAEIQSLPSKTIQPLADFIRPTDTPYPTATPTQTPTITPTATAIPTATPTDPPIILPTAQLEETQPTAEPTPTLIPPTPTQTPTPLPTPQTPDGQAVRVPILMYHYVSSPPADADKYRLDLSVKPSELINQLTYLRDNGYTIVSLYDVARARAGVAQLPEKPIVLTFDDGHLDNYTNAFPVLKSFGVTATFFIITDLADIEHPDYMNWAMIEEMAAAGMDFEIHTKSHRSLRDRNDDFLREEIFGAQEILAFHTGKLPRFLAYPGGAYDETAINFARNLDLWGALTTEHGYTHSLDNRYVMPRVRIRNTTTVEWFAKWIEGDVE